MLETKRDRPLDPITFEIIRHRLNQVIEEAIVALENVSGSPAVNEGHDMMVSLYGPDGGLMIGGVGYLHHLTSAAQAVKHIIATFPGEEIGEGDAFMLNDPYTAALHPPDIYIISPIHCDGELTGFVSNFVHVTDIGALEPGGFSPSARDTFQEGFVTEGLKIVDGGRPRRDVIATFLRNGRDPGMTALDLKSQLAANHVAKDRMRKLYADYGVPTIQAVSEKLLEESERLTRQRLAELPDGEWFSRQYVDMPSGLYRVELKATKEGDSLTYDFTGTDPQIIEGVNCAYWATWGALFAPIFPMLAWDMTWNEGITRPIRMIAPEGTLVNCTRPCPISIATTGIVQVVNNLSLIVLAKMLGSSDKYRDRATAVWHGSHVPVFMSGLNAQKEFFVTVLTDSFAGAGGARAAADGVDIGGEIPNCVSRWANAETQEVHTPIVYLWRKPVVDSGGPGKYRGGVGHEFAIKPHDTGSGSISLMMSTKGLTVPTSLGIFGGLPGCTVATELYRGAAVEGLPSSRDELAGDGMEIDQWGRYEASEEDVQYVRFSAGGGYGDPIDRDPGLVAEDVMMGLVSTEAAKSIYGVALHKDGTLDQPGTDSLRADIRKERLGRAVKAQLCTRQEVPRSGRALGEYLQEKRGDMLTAQCTWCGLTIATAPERWKDRAVVKELPPSAAGTYRTSAQGLVLRQFYCPQCATLLDTEVTLEDDPPLYDATREWNHAR